MSGSSEVLQEYLLSLGYKIDEVSLGKFNSGIGKTGKNIMRVGGAVASVVAAVEASTAAFAYSMRKVYFQSQLANSSIKNLNALSFAGKQVGIGGEAMGNAIQTMSRGIRMNPGMQSLIESFGVPVTGRDASDVATDMLGVLKKMPEFVGVQWAQKIFGMDADTFHLVTAQLDTLKKKKEEALDIQKKMGVDPDAAAAAMLHYAGTIDTLQEKFKGLGQVMMIEFAPQFDNMNSMVSNAIDWWADWARGINSVKDVLKNTDFSAIYTDLKMSFSQSEADKKAGKPKSFMEWIFSNPFEKEPSPKISKPAKQMQDFGGTGRANTPANTNPPAQPAGAPGAGRGSQGVYTSSGKQTAELRKADEIIQAMQSMGWTRAQSIGIAANLKRESNFDPQAQGDRDKNGVFRAYGIAQWHPDRQAEFEKFAGKSMRESDLMDQLKFLNFELRHGKERSAGGLLQKAETPEGAAEIVSNYYERPKDKEGEARLRRMEATRLGSTTSNVVNISPTTTINVTGIGAEATAQAVGREQVRVYGDTVRNARGLLR